MLNLLFGFNGRMGRLGWWSMHALYWLLTLGAALALVLVATVAGEEALDFLEKSSAATGIIFLWTLMSLWITVAATVKRYHDRDKSGYWWLLCIIPFGLIFVIIECGFFPGTEGTNSYGDAYRTSTKEELIASVRDGDGVRPDVRQRREAKNEGRQEVQINRPAGHGFGRRAT